MSKAGFEGFSGADGSAKDANQKPGIAEADAKHSAFPNEDPSRSALHYGEDHRGETHQSALGTADGHGEGSSAYHASEQPGVDAPTARSGADGSAVGAGADKNAGLEASQGQARTETGAVSPQAQPMESGLDFGATAPGHAAEYGATGATEPAISATHTDRDLEFSSSSENENGRDSSHQSGDPLTGNQDSHDPATDQAVATPEVPTSHTETSSPAAVPETAIPAASSPPPNAAPTDVSLSNTAIASGSEGAIVGSVHVEDPDASDSHSFTVSDTRFEVAGGVLRLRAGQSLDHDNGEPLTIEVTATDASGAEVTESFDIEVVEAPSITAGSGFHARYFDVDHSLQRLDEIDWDSAPTHQELVNDIDYENGRGSFWEDGATDTFGAQITGAVEVEEGGTFTFKLGGDDGAALFVNGVEVIENDGLHSYHARSGEIELDPGTHHIEVRYFENYGHAGLKLEWEGPGIDGRELVTAPEIEDAQTVNGVPCSLSLNTEDVPENAALALEGLPEGTLLHAGDDSAMIGAEGSADVTGWDMSVLTITTPVDFLGTVDASIVTTTPTGSGQSVTTSETVSFQVNPAQIEPMPIEVVGGFEASYFDVDHALSDLSDIDWSAPPTHSEMVREINYENAAGVSFWEGGDTDTFGAKLEGMINVDSGGTYEFTLGADDGVVLFVDGTEVVENDGLHSYRSRSGEIELEPGPHHIEVRYFENFGRAGLKLEWEGPDTDGKELVQANPDLEVPENGTLSIGLDMGTVSDDAIVEMHGLPPHTILMDGETSMVSDGGPVDISALDLNTFEMAPPPGFEGEISGEVVLQDTAFNGQMVTSATEFSVTVGDDVEAGQSDDAEEALLLADASESSDTDAGLLALDDADDAQSGDDSEVLEQPVEQTANDDQTVQNMDSYERYDW